VATPPIAFDLVSTNGKRKEKGAGLILDQHHLATSREKFSTPSRHHRKRGGEKKRTGKPGFAAESVVKGENVQRGKKSLRMPTPRKKKNDSRSGKRRAVRSHGNVAGRDQKEKKCKRCVALHIVEHEEEEKKIWCSLFG